MEKTHNTNEKLDAVLTVLNNLNKELINAQGFAKLSVDNEIDLTKILFRLVNIGVKDIDLIELQLILPYLISENYIEKYDAGIERAYHSLYRIRFNGKVFIENGGFVSKAADINSQTIRQAKLEKNVRFLNRIIATGTMIAAIYYAFEIWKYYFGYINPKGLP